MFLLGLLNEFLKLLIVISIFWGVYNLYLAIYLRVQSVKKPQLYAISKLRIKDFLESIIFLFLFWLYIVMQVYLYGLGVIDSGLRLGKNVVCVGVRINSFCLGKEETIHIKTNN